MAGDGRWYCRVAASPKITSAS